MKLENRKTTKVDIFSEDDLYDQRWNSASAALVDPVYGAGPIGWWGFLVHALMRRIASGRWYSFCCWPLLTWFSFVVFWAGTWYNFLVGLPRMLLGKKSAEICTQKALENDIETLNWWLLVDFKRTHTCTEHKYAFLCKFFPSASCWNTN